MESESGSRVSTRLLQLVHSRAGAKPPAAAPVPAPTPPRPVADEFARQALLIAHQHLSVLTPANIVAEQVNATSTIVQAFDATAQFIQHTCEKTVPHAEAPACWRIVATALSCVLGGIDPITVDPYGMAGAAFTAFAGACLMLQSLNCIRDSLLTVAEGNLLVPTQTEALVEGLEHTATCDDCLQQEGTDDD